MNLPAIAQQRGIDEATWSALNNSVFTGARPESIIMAVDYCRARKLDVLKKPCHIVPMKVNDQWRDIIMPSIYEQRTTAFRTGQMAGQDDPVFGELIEYKGVTAPEWCRVTVYRLIAGQRCAFSHTEYFVESCATVKKKEGEFINSMWRKRPRGQLAKCAEAGALRKAFPDELGGIIAAEEVQESPSNTEAATVVQEAVIMADAEQLAKIQALAQETGAEIAAICMAYKVESLQELSQGDADRIIHQLHRKKAMAQEASAQEAQSAPPPAPEMTLADDEIPV